MLAGWNLSENPRPFKGYSGPGERDQADVDTKHDPTHDATFGFCHATFADKERVLTTLAFCLAMPKAPGKFTVPAKNEPLGRTEYITPSKDIREKYKDLGAPRRYPKPKFNKHKPRTLTEEERKQLLQEAEARAQENALASKLFFEKQKLKQKSLLERISIPLEQRITGADYEYKPVDLSNLHFTKNAYLKRLSEVAVMIDAVMGRLAPLVTKLNDEDAREDLNLSTRVDPEVRQKLWVMYNSLQDVYEEYDTKGKEWYHKKWRRLIGALKRIGKVSFERLEERFPEICNELVALNLTFHDL